MKLAPRKCVPVSIPPLAVLQKASLSQTCANIVFLPNLTSEKNVLLAKFVFLWLAGDAEHFLYIY